MIIPAILTNSEKELLSQISQVKDIVSLVHIDIMDGSITKEKTIDPSLIKKIDFPSEIHFMCNTPSSYIKDIETNFVKKIIVQREINNFEKEMNIFNKKYTVYVSLDIDTKIDSIKEFKYQLDGIMLMGVKIGRSGQKFTPSILDKVNEAKELTRNLEIDGGITLDNINSCIKMGVRDYAINSSIYKTKNIKETIEKFNLQIAI